MSAELSTGIILIFVFLAIIAGLPLAWIFGLAALGLVFLFGRVDFMVVMPSAMKLLTTFSYLALPMYILVGTLMEAGVLSSRLIEWLTTLLGGGKSVFGAIAVVFCTIFGAISGSGLSAVAAIGPVLIPKAEHYGYNKEYITGLIACSSLIVMLIPPSMPLIMYGVSAELSVARCFLTTAIPGLIISVLYIVINYFLTRRISAGSIRPQTKRGVAEILRSTKRASSALMLPLIILGGIYGGVFTPTEAAAVAVAWILFDGFVIHREFIPKFNGALLEAGKITGAIGILIFFLFTMSQILIWLRVPQVLQSILFSLVTTKMGFLVLASVLIFFLGLIIEGAAVVILAAILLVPVAISYGVDPYHFAAIVVINTGVGNLTPPVAPILYAAATVGGASTTLFPPSRYIKTVLTYLLFGHLPTFILVLLIPEVSLFLPNLWERMLH